MKKPLRDIIQEKHLLKAIKHHRWIMKKNKDTGLRDLTIATAGVGGLLTHGIVNKSQAALITGILLAPSVAFGAATHGAHIYQVRKRYKEIEKKNV